VLVFKVLPPIAVDAPGRLSFDLLDRDALSVVLNDFE
jgi:hypothetical protein